MVIGTPFVGRRRELDLLRGKLFDPRPGAVRFVGVTGEPGLGKTRLLAEFAALARDAGVLVVAGHTSEFERHVPFGVLSGDSLSTMDMQDVRYDAAAGNPLYLEALARHPDADGHGALAAELATLGHIDLQVARAVAVVADVAEPALVAAAADLSLTETLAAPDRLTERDLLRPLGTSGGEGDLANPLFRACGAALFERMAGRLAPAVQVLLTPRELTALALAAESLTAKAIARRLGIETGTVQKHLENACRKLGTGDRLTNVLRAQTLGLLPRA